MPRGPARRKEKARGGLALGAACILVRIADFQPVGQRRAGRGGQRHDAFLAAFAQYQQHARIAPCRTDGQSDQLRHAHPRGIEQFHQTGVACGIRLIAPRCAGGLQQAVDLGNIQGLGQAFVLTRTRDLDRGVFGAPAFLEGKAVHLLDRRQPPRTGGFGQALIVAKDQIGLDVVLLHGVEGTAPTGGPFGEILQIAPVGQQGVLCSPQFGGLRFDKCGNPAVGVGAHNAGLSMI